MELSLFQAIELTPVTVYRLLICLHEGSLEFSLTVPFVYFCLATYMYTI